MNESEKAAPPPSTSAAYEQQQPPNSSTPAAQAQQPPQPAVEEEPLRPTDPVQASPDEPPAAQPSPAPMGDDDLPELGKHMLGWNQVKLTRPTAVEDLEDKMSDVSFGQREYRPRWAADSRRK